MGLAGFEVEVQRQTDGGGLVTEDMTLSMGPQPPSPHGVLRFLVRADAEVMKEAIPHIGYLHRSIEKIAEKVGWHGFLPYTDRVDYVAAMFCNHGWAMAAEKLARVARPPAAAPCPTPAASPTSPPCSAITGGRWRRRSSPASRCRGARNTAA